MKEYKFKGFVTELQLDNYVNTEGDRGIIISSEKTPHAGIEAEITIKIKEKKTIVAECYINVYADGYTFIYDTKELSDTNAPSGAIACEHFKKTYEVDV